MYALMENHDYALKMQQEMIREIELNKPKLLIFVHIPTSWLRRPDSHKLIFDWSKDYQKKNFYLAGLVELYSDTALYHWTPNVKWPPGSPFWVAVLVRKETLQQSQP